MSDLRNLHRQLRHRLRPAVSDSFLPATAEPAPAATEPSLLPSSQPPPSPVASTRATPLPAADPDSFLPPPAAPSGPVVSAPPVQPDSFLPPVAPQAAERTDPPAQTLSAALPGTEQLNSLGAWYRLRWHGRELAPDGPELVAAWRRVGKVRRARLAELFAVEAARILFLDLETCGLRAVPLFLVGLGWLGEDDAELELLLARDLSEEAAVVQAAAERLRQADAVVTFNGTTFDLPFLRDRARYHQLGLNVPAHFDLLPLARAKVGKRYGDCRLQTLERGLCGRVRDDDDVPGAEIPERYRRFTKTGNAALLRPILTHNAQDLLSLMALAPALTRPSAD